MEFDLTRRHAPNKHFPKDILGTAYEFVKLTHKELGDIIRAAVLFGSAAHPDDKDPHDIDILLVIDDIEISFTKELQAAYRVIIENCVKATSPRIHVTTLRFSNFWEYVRTSDPVVVSVLREGRALIDTGFFVPMQLLLQQGRIRPTLESIWAYYSRAPQLLIGSKWKVMLGVVDLYWSVINSAHAALMAAGVTPQAPEHVAGLLREHFVRKGLLEDVYAQRMDRFYHLQKDIFSRRIENISGARWEKLWHEADDFVKTMRTLIE